MLYGMKAPQLSFLEQTLAAMCNSCHNFYLTGSRFFGNDTPDSDYDFFCQISPVVIDWLEANSFVRVHDKNVQDMYLGDSMSVEIWRYIYEDTHIDVQLVNDLALKIKCNNFIMQFKNELHFNDMAKAAKKKLWTKAAAYFR